MARIKITEKQFHILKENSLIEYDDASLQNENKKPVYGIWKKAKRPIYKAWNQMSWHIKPK